MQCPKCKDDKLYRIDRRASCKDGSSRCWANILLGNVHTARHCNWKEIAEKGKECFENQEYSDLSLLLSSTKCCLIDREILRRNSRREARRRPEIHLAMDETQPANLAFYRNLIGAE